MIGADAIEPAPAHLAKALAKRPRGANARGVERRRERRAHDAMAKKLARGKHDARADDDENRRDERVALLRPERR